jgi:hypothetical protein
VHQKRKPSEFRLLGDIDEQGTSLVMVLDRIMDSFESTNADDSIVVRCVSREALGDELRIITQHGQNGVAADIVDGEGELRLRQTPDDTQLIRCGCLFRLPPAEQMGWFVLHVNNGRGVKGLLAKGVVEQLRDAYPDLTLEMTPYVQKTVLAEAIKNNRIDKVKLVKLQPPNDRAVQATNKWVRAGAFARLELDISVRGRAERVLSGLLRRYVDGESSAFSEIVEFEGITFDEAKVEVVLENNMRRTFNIEKPDSGHPFTEDITGLVVENGEPTQSSLFEALRSVLNTVSA